MKRLYLSCVSLPVLVTSSPCHSPCSRWLYHTQWSFSLASHDWSYVFTLYLWETTSKYLPLYSFFPFPPPHPPKGKKVYSLIFLILSGVQKVPLLMELHKCVSNFCFSVNLCMQGECFNKKVSFIITCI